MFILTPAAESHTYEESADSDKKVSLISFCGAVPKITLLHIRPICLLQSLSVTNFSGLISLSDVVDSIRLDHVGVPSYAIQGKQAVLECPYDLEGSSLYSVKWYKNGREFFR